MTDRDDSTAKEIARDVARVLPLLGCPRWLLWLASIGAVVLYVVVKRLVPTLARAFVEAAKNAKPQQVMDEGGPQPEGQDERTTAGPTRAGYTA